MNIDIKRWTPWNWLKGEQQQEGRNLPTRQNDRSAGLPSLYNDHPLWNLHREMDRVFDNFFQRFDGQPPF